MFWYRGLRSSFRLELEELQALAVEANMTRLRQEEFDSQHNEKLRKRGEEEHALLDGGSVTRFSAVGPMLTQKYLVTNNSKSGDAQISVPPC